MEPFEAGIQQVYTEIRESLALILEDVLPTGSEHGQHALISLDDAVSNNWDELVRAFWRGAAEEFSEDQGKRTISDRSLTFWGPDRHSGRNRKR